MSDRVDLRDLETGETFRLITDDGRVRRYVVYTYHSMRDLVTVRDLATGAFRVMDASKVTAEPADEGGI